MMSAQMVNVSGSAGTVADLAPGVKDGMRMLEAQAAEVAQMESRLGQYYLCFVQILHSVCVIVRFIQFPFFTFTVMPKGGNILFVRGETQGGDREAARVVNPDEIDIDDDEEEEEDGSGSEDGKEEEGMKTEIFISLCC